LGQVNFDTLLQKSLSEGPQARSEEPPVQHRLGQGKGPLSSGFCLVCPPKPAKQVLARLRGARASSSVWTAVALPCQHAQWRAYISTEN
jgi:hypothetical protein